ncbi:MAG: tRNA (adenosine(37)-N6)-threonylcarbamoyltransferase complex ATPase subunit type 1 TsaE [Ileibacterium sp.]|nr:tRNA (adenosine(37)-N6)-threonylcarbamoyltransferase complex ATPase subunit type 1 TsaE [Ileibacterium sp.]
MKRIEIHSLEETRDFAQKMAGLCRGKVITIVLDGDLGAGKTTWTQSFGKALGVKRTINSPTFTIMKSYKQEDGEPLSHIDAYRLEGMHQDLGFEDCFDSGICVVEWGGFLADQLPKDRIEISLQEGIDENRVMEMQGTGPVSNAIVEEFVC